VSAARRAPSDAQAPLTPEEQAPGASGASEASAPTGAHAPAGEQLTYEQAAARVEEIIKRLDSGDASLNETLELVGEGKALIELCAGQLAEVSGALEELRLEELVSRLEREASP
jgi:exodeoxyribonuclease VII small subunit